MVVTSFDSLAVDYCSRAFYMPVFRSSKASFESPPFVCSWKDAFFLLLCGQFPTFSVQNQAARLPPCDQFASSNALSFFYIGNLLAGKKLRILSFA